ncbi:MAG: sulfatase-like hydrolase/transferase [Candidatus Latescibacteria bacterium]|nr:sulfatase-like hydrolase/transferase [Candidatus Latescibacterota bacterium]
MSERPNIVLVLTDHFRGDCLSRLGHPAAETPHLDSLSRQGGRFQSRIHAVPLVHRRA